MILIVGLGNPGEKYQQTRHNIGWQTVKTFAEGLDFPKFKLNKNLKAEISKKDINGETLVLALPITFMNESGQAVKILNSNHLLLKL